MCIDFFFNTQRSWPGGCGRSYEIYNISIVWIIYNNPCAYIRYLVHLSLRAMVVPAVYNRHYIYIYIPIYTPVIYINIYCIIIYKVYLPIARDSGTFPRVCWPLEGVIYVYANGQRAQARLYTRYYIGTLTVRCKPVHNNIL